MTPSYVTAPQNVCVLLNRHTQFSGLGNAIFWWDGWCGQSNLYILFSASFFLSSVWPSSHSQVSGTPARKQSKTLCFSEQAWLTQVLIILMEQERTTCSSVRTTCLLKATTAEMPAWARCTQSIQPGIQPATAAEKKAISREHVSLFCSLSTGIHNCFSRNAEGTSLLSAFSLHLWPCCWGMHARPLGTCRYSLCLHLLQKRVLEIHKCSVKDCHLLPSDYCWDRRKLLLGVTGAPLILILQDLVNLNFVSAYPSLYFYNIIACLHKMRCPGLFSFSS